MIALSERPPQTGGDVVRADLETICQALQPEFAQLAGRKLLITGGAGFLGYYLVQSALDFNSNNGGERIEVTVFDNFVRGVPGWLTALEDDPALALIRHDVSRPLPRHLHEFDYIIHAAGIASPTFYRRYPLETIDANINGLRNLLDECRRRADAGRPVEGMLFFSSSEIYGDPPPEQIPTGEDYRGHVSCTGPRACYDESKRFGETLCVTFARQYGVSVKMARPFNNYGPGLKITDGRVIPDLVRNVLAGEDIVLLSDGAPTRTFCYAADAVAGYYKVLVNGRAGEAYNIGVERPEISMRDLARWIAELGRELCDYRGRVVQRASDEAAYLIDNPQRRCPDIGKARHELGYEPRMTLEEGLRRSLLWYQANSTAEVA